MKKINNTKVKRNSEEINKTKNKLKNTDNSNKLTIKVINNDLDVEKKNSFSTREQKKGFLSLNNLFDENNNNKLIKTISPKLEKRMKYNSIQISENNNIYKQTDIRNYINLSKLKYDKFNTICQDLRNSFIMKDKTNNKIFKTTIKINKDNPELNDSILSIEKEKKYKEELENNSNELSINSIESNEIEIKEIRFRRLMKEKQLVYDSLSDEEYLEDIEGLFYIEPNGNFLYFFDMILLLLSIYAIIFPPIDFAFNIHKSHYYITKNVIVEHTIDLFFLIDFFIGFFVAYYTFDEQLITKSKLIIEHYLKGWFWINFISGIPINSIFVVVDYYRMKDKIIYTNISYLIDIFELFRLFRILKLFKTFTNNSFIRRVSIKLNTLDTLLIKWFTLYMFLFIFFVSIHLLSCVYIFLSQLSHPNWIYINNLEIQNKFEVYISSLYFICATIFTIGYGDIVSISLYERFFNLILLVVGIMIYSYAVSALSNHVQSIDSKTLDYRNKLEILEEIRINHEKMPQTLFEKISKFLLYRLYNGKRDTNDIIDNLPLALKNKLIMEMYKDVINNFIFFKNFSNSDFVIRVILAFKPIQASKNERLVNEGDYLEEIIFVKKGKLSLEIPIPVIIKNETIQKIQTIRRSRASLKFNLTKGIIPIKTFNNNIIPNEIEGPTEEEIKEIKTLKNFNNEINQRQYIKIIEIRKNEHFGDILMFLNKRSPLSVRVKSKNCELFLLKKTEAVEISMDFPRIWRKIIKKSLFNMEQIERLMNKTLKFFYIRNEGNKPINNGKYYFRIDPSHGNKLLNETKLINSFKNSNEQYELQSIPSEENDEEDEEEEEEEEEKENEENDDNTLNDKKASNIKSIINEVDENSSLESKSVKSDISKKTIINIKSENSMNSEKTLNEYKKNSDSDRESNLSVKTIVTNSNKNFFDNFSEDNSIQEKKTLISSGLCYSINEINNESFPFEESIKINSNEKISCDLLPKVIKTCSKDFDFIALNDNESFNSFKKQFPNSILMLINNKKPKTLYHKGNNDSNINKINTKDNIIIKKSSFDSIDIQNIENFTLKGETKQKENFKNYFEQFQNNLSNNNNNNNNTNNNNLDINYYRTSSTPMNSIQLKRLNKPKNTTKSSKNKYTIRIDKCDNNPPIIKKRLSKLMFDEENNLENNTLSPEEKSSFYSFVQSIGNENNVSFNENDKDNYQKRRKTLFLDPSKKNYLNIIEKSVTIKSSDDLRNEKSIISKKSNNINTLDLIRNNIEKNSLNLNNPEYFYSKYFSSVINENKPKNEFRNRLKNLAKIIKNNKKDLNEEEEKEELRIKGKT